MNEILEIDAELKDIAKKLRNPDLLCCICHEILKKKIEISLDSSDYESEISNIENEPGIYIFYISNLHVNENVDGWFTKIWSTKDIVGFQHSPAIINKRIRQKDNSLEWIELYLGKTERLRDRISAHIELAGNKRTFALKLKARGENLLKAKFKINWIVLKELKETQIILRILEEELRDRYKPVTGRQ